MDLSVSRQLTALVDQIETIIVGKRAQIEDCVACIMAGGHLLIEDVPGVGKTTLAHALAASLGPSSSSPRRTPTTSWAPTRCPRASSTAS
jgi:MoxR-like ATPase